MIYRGSAASNIALIKYMGKIEPASTEERNRPTNSSVSFTLEHLRTFIEIESVASLSADEWQPLNSLSGFDFSAAETSLNRELYPMELSEKGRTRFLQHLANVKTKLGFKQYLIVRSANNFPSDCGIASSASSFAALTKVAAEAICKISGREMPSSSVLADWSREGSGSSCRSFFSPWSLWTHNGAQEISLDAKPWLHQVLLLESGKKLVSSSQAHKLVSNSLLFKGRPERAETRLGLLISNLHQQNWIEACELAWAEFWDMHALFETSTPSFGYMNGECMQALNTLRERMLGWGGKRPMVTMDAGPNIHLLYRADGIETAKEVEKIFAQHKILKNY